MTSAKTVYFDYNATALIRPEVIALMLDIMGRPGNASAVHGYGRSARSCVEKAREQVGALCSVNPNQVVFNSGATEANNTVLKSFAGERILISSIEHLSVLEPTAGAEQIPVTADGLIDEAEFEALLDKGPAPALISIMMVNNETGAIQQVEKLARLAKKKFPSVYFHTDAVQAAGKLRIDFPALQVDYLSLSAHKIGGPQGVGALISAPGARPARLLHGSAQEKRQRAGTENVAGIAGFGLAAEMAAHDVDNYNQRLSALRDRLENEVKRISPEVVIFAKRAARVPNVTSMSLPGTQGQMMLMALDLEGMAVSRGSACSSGTVKPSHVIRAMGATDAEVAGALRISMGWNTQAEDVDAFIAAWLKIARRTTEKTGIAAHA
ncbi:MAG TPA: cysteine desulfurase family protein [Alphaproteobacteria bacterium]|jgi:cysteine desulfurase